jgi:hypothetical protein
VRAHAVVVLDEVINEGLESGDGPRSFVGLEVFLERLVETFDLAAGLGR